SKKFKIAEGQWYRYAPSYVSPAYHLLEGFPFIQEPPSGDLQERVLIRHHDYDQCFQSVQLLQWLPTVNTTGYIDHAAFLGTINPDTNKIPKHLFQGYLNIYNNYFKAPWMPDRTEANPNELNQDDARYGFRCCHL